MAEVLLGTEAAPAHIDMVQQVFPALRHGAAVEEQKNLMRAGRYIHPSTRRLPFLRGVCTTAEAIDPTNRELAHRIGEAWRTCNFRI